MAYSLESGLTGANHLLRLESSLAPEKVIEYIRYFAFSGAPENMRLYIDKTGVEPKWAAENDVVVKGYEAIVARIRRTPPDTGINETEFKRLRMMRDITGIEMPDGLNRLILGKIIQVRLRYLVPALREYVTCMNPKIEQNQADGLYKAKRINVKATSNVDYALQMFDIVKIRPSGEMRELLARDLTGCLVLNKIEGRLRLFADSKDVGTLLEEAAFNESGAFRVGLVIKLACGVELTRDEVEGIYDNIIISVGEGDTRIAGENAKFLISHKIMPPPEIAERFEKLCRDLSASCGYRSGLAWGEVFRMLSGSA